jgi:flagellar motor switch protein FliG
MKNFIYILFCTFAFSANEPFMVETKVQNDLELAVSRIIPREQFFILVTSEIVVRSEKRLMEGETITESREPEEAQMDLMPGFLPEPTPKEKARPPQERKIYRVIDTPTLGKIRAHVNFDDGLNPNTMLKARLLVQSYMTQNYPMNGVVTFAQFPMLKPVKEDKKEATPEPKKDEPKPIKPEKEEPKLEDKIKAYSLWGLLGLFFILLAYLWHRLSLNETKQELRAQEDKARRREDALKQQLAQQNAWNPLAAFDGQKLAKKKDNEDDLEEEFKADTPEEERVAQQKKQLIHLFLAKPEAFRLYFQRLNNDLKGELCASLRSLAFDKLMEGLNLPQGEVDENDPPELEEKLLKHRKSFDDFARAKDWQDKQFFGFLQQVPDETLKAIASFQTPTNVCVMLRFLKPSQSAMVLDAMPGDKKADIISCIPNLKNISYSKITEIENEVRQMLTKMPKPLFGSQKDEVNFWGDVIIQSQSQDEVYEGFEKTQPEISPKLAKFKFKLEDCAVLPEDSLKQVLGDIDNEELSMALATVSDNVTDVILEALPASRQQVLRKLRQGSQWVSKEELERARINVTKKFREVIK